ncbi:hypothetical protein BSLG_009696 [Batrachochytrium salamandrivorans]|nr:hypothetical protein BSLG_009696 [Batrachochytrium salamandrivorans]
MGNIERPCDYITEKYVDKLYFVEPTKRSQHSSSLYMLDQKLSVKMLSSLEIRSQSEPLPRISLSSPTVEIDSSLFSSLSIARKSCTHPPPQLLPDLLSDGDAAQVPDDDFATLLHRHRPIPGISIDIRHQTAAFALGRGWASLTPIADQSLSSGLEDFNLSSITSFQSHNSNPETND